jgi:signal transduction histidine kinase
LVNPLKKFHLRGIASTNGSPQDFTGQAFDEAQMMGSNFLEFLPCVIYECTALLDLTYLSKNVEKLLSVQAYKLVGNRLLWEERILPEDSASLREKINKLTGDETASSIHRIIDDHGLPIWVSHSFRRVQTRGMEVIRGSIMPLGNEKRIRNLEPSTTAKFVHKLGNHFQVLNLVINSLSKVLPESRETAALKHTVEKATELTRTFSEYSQIPTAGSVIEFVDIIEAAVMRRKGLFAETGIVFHQKIDESARGVTLRGDPYLLELAVGNVLENALEATQVGGTVMLNALAEASDPNAFVAKLSVSDTGSGIGANHLDKAAVPFFTTKKDHDGLGLSMAVRFIEMHGGLLRINNKQGQGTEVEIALPADASVSSNER